jgi:hypothetical protein
MSYTHEPCSVTAFPRWPQLAHFDGIINKDFNDGKKWEDIAKVSSKGKLFQLIKPTRDRSSSMSLMEF